MTTTTTLSTKQQQMLDAVAAGESIFFHDGPAWSVMGPATDITPGATVTITKKSGATSQVIIDTVWLTATVHDVTYATASFHNPPKPKTHSHHSHHHSYTSHKTDHEDCLSLGCCGYSCEYHGITCHKTH